MTEPLPAVHENRLLVSVRLCLTVSSWGLLGIDREELRGERKSGRSETTGMKFFMLGDVCFEWSIWLVGVGGV